MHPNQTTPAPADDTTTGTTTYTVVGLWLGERALVAGVIEGDHPMVDSTVDDDHQRWSLAVQTSDPTTAEAAALAELAD